MKKNFILILSVLFFALESRAQNLVINPSFENLTTSCSGFTGAGYINLVAWDNPDPTDTCSTPDWFSTCLSTLFPTHAPNSQLGNQNARTGDAYAGFIGYDATSNSYREYVEGQLSSPLTAGQQYCVTFYVSLADATPYAIDKIGMYLSNTFTQFPVSHCVSTVAIPVTPQLQWTGGVISDKVNWVRLQWSYIATGGERYFTIGNFFNNSGTTIQNVGGGGLNPFAYYFVDDVSIEAGICCNNAITPVAPICASSAPIILTAETPGGTWSGAGITNPATGAFSPSVAGVGPHVITYTLACGAGTTTITVNPCLMNACQETSGNVTIAGASGACTWYNSATTTPCIPGLGFCSTFGTVAGPPVTTWTSFATGTTANPGTNYPIWVVDAVGDSLQITSLASLPNCTTVSCPPLTVTPSAQVNVNCFGQSTGSFSATTSGGASPYDYALLNGITTVATFTNVAGAQAFTNLPAGTYTLNVVDNNGCPGSTTITITQPASAAAVAITGSTNAACGTSTGSATAQASGGSSPYDYVWTGTSGTLQTTNNITTANTLSGLAAGTYTITITDNNGCTATTTATITSTGGATVTISSQANVLCFGGTTGNAAATASGGSSPYDYVWTGTSGTLQTDNNITGADTLNALAAGTYTVTVTDNAGCTGTATATITQPATAAAVAITGSTTTTCGTSTGTATAQASGGSTPYDYVWTGTSGTLQTTNNITTANTLSGMAAGTYTVTITDNNGCIATTTVTITSTGGATVSITSQTNVLCFGGTTGSATATAAAGTSPYDYVWMGTSGTLQTDNNIAGPDTLNGLATGTYTVTVTDNGGCVSTATVTITQPATAAAVAITGTTPAACGTANGSATAQASGGTGPYDYVWTNASGTLQTTNNVSGSDVLNSIAAGTYTITITDNNGCTSSTTASVSNSGGATTSITSQTNVLCFGGTTGSATANTSGGTSPYDYVWTGSSGVLQTVTNISVPNTLSGLGAGTYTVSVTDNGGCVSTQTVTITQPSSALALAAGTPTSTTCGLNNGSGSVTASGGTSGYLYSWAASGGTGTSASGLASGTYTVTVTDANGCTANTTLVIGSSTGITATASHTNVLCAGANTGTATAIPSGGTGTYTYSWSGGAGTGATASGLSAGTYTVTVNNSGCSATASVTITQPTAITANVNTTPAACTSATGTATVIASGGTGALTYLWSTAATTASISNVASGTVSVTVTDANGCTQTAAGVVGVTGGVTANAGPNVTIISGSSTTLTATGGTNYVWSPATGLSCSTCPSTVATPTVSTQYCVTVSNTSGCADSDCVIIDVDIKCGELFVPTAFSPNADNENDVLYVMGNCIKDLNFAIYDRWGEKVFETSDPATGWDGSKNGKALDAAVFVYYLKATVDGIEVKKHGNITLIK